jgi:DNA-binding response OmpR family regulator
MANILIIDDDPDLCEMLSEYLAGEGHAICVKHDGEDGLPEALSGRHEAVVLDVMMPRMDGLKTLRLLRATSSIPVIMLTARGDDVDRIVGLELGADDYLPKPFNPRELAARVRAILRRGQERSNSALQTIVVGALTIRPAERNAEWRGLPLTLTSTEYSILEVLAKNAGQIVGKNEISEQALGRQQARFDRTIDMHISNIRQKIGTLKDGRSPILTVRGIGYQYLVGE